MLLLQRFLEVAHLIKPRILIVEDERVVALEIKEFLEQKGFDVSEPAGSPNEAVEAICCTEFDLILMDINLNSFIDGIDAAQRIHLMKNIPIIYTTAYPDSEIKHRAMKTNPIAYVEKPVNLDQLYEIIKKALHSDLQTV